MDKALKEGHKDREIVALLIEENVLYAQESEDEENEQVVKPRAPSGRNLLRHQTSHHERSHAGREERSAAASRRYLKNSISSNKIKDASHASVIGVTGTERCGGEETTVAASWALLYDCRWWTYDQGGNDAVGRDASNDTALANRNHPSTDTSVAAAFESIASNVAATLHPSCTTPWVAVSSGDTGVHGATATRHSAVSDLPGADATARCNPWGRFLATTWAIVELKRETVMCSEDHGMDKYCHAARSEVPHEVTRAEPRKAVLSTRHFSSKSPDSASRHEVGSNWLEVTSTTYVHGWRNQAPARRR
ncbi:hypothetical protein HPB51_015000 [Rhipicephalus microplus]|uniref:Uncharacterized protein n=1 Tax=Rhipicephalus microplus TaxID=6941 RepID=A0A9J6EGZ3_RHIMP|nr:hypothetical protein HPB51_015000 [Rhipicephalus microplus]